MVYNTSHLLGKIKLLNETTYEVSEKFGIAEREKEILRVIIHNDINQNIISRWELKELKDFEQEDYKYDDKGNMIEYTRSSRDIAKKEDVRVIVHSKFKYDDKGNNIEIVDYNDDGGINQKSFHKYDDMGNEIECYIVDNDDKIRNVGKYVYDNTGNKIKDSWYDGDEFYFNRHGEIIIENVDETLSNFDYEYDDSGNLIKASVSDPFNFYGPMEEIRKYDNKGNLIEDSKKFSGSFLDIPDYVTVTKYKYDNLGNLIESNSYDEKGSLKQNKKWKYVYDQNTNWTKKWEYIDNNAKLLIERIIEYYD